MNLEEVYLDTCILIGCLEWLIKKGYHKISYFDKLLRRDKEQPFVIVFFKEHEKVTKWISLVSEAEIMKILKFDNKFKKYNLTYEQIIGLIEILREILNFRTIVEFEKDGKTIKGNLVTGDIRKYAYEHDHIIDCIHVDISRQNELLFITEESRLPKLNKLTNDIITFNGYTKQFE